MAEENEEVVDKKAAKKAEKARRKEEKKMAKKNKAEADDLDMEEDTAGVNQEIRLTVGSHLFRGLQESHDDRLCQKKADTGQNHT